MATRRRLSRVLHEEIEVLLDRRRRPDLDGLVLQDLGHLAQLGQRRHEPWKQPHGLGLASRVDQEAEEQQGEVVLVAPVKQ